MVRRHDRVRAAVSRPARARRLTAAAARPAASSGTLAASRSTTSRTSASSSSSVAVRPYDAPEPMHRRERRSRSRDSSLRGTRRAGSPPVGDRPPGQLLERQLPGHRALHQDALVGQVAERLGQPHGTGSTAERPAATARSSPPTRTPPLSPVMGLEDDAVRRHRTRSTGRRRSSPDHDGAAAAGLVPHDDRVAGGDRGVSVARLPEDRLEQPGRLRRVDQTRQRRQRVVRGLRPAGRASDPAAHTATRAHRTRRRPGRRPSADWLPSGRPQVADEHDRRAAHPPARRRRGCTAPATRRPWRAAGRAEHASRRSASVAELGHLARRGPRGPVARPSPRPASRAAHRRREGVEDRGRVVGGGHGRSPSPRGRRAGTGRARGGGP